MAQLIWLITVNALTKEKTMQTQPFKRAMAMMAAIQAIISSAPASMHNILIGQLGPYKSRGHGRGSYAKHPNYTTPWLAKLKGQTNGQQECARRVRQMAALA
jgi:hypothetical protein